MPFLLKMNFSIIMQNLNSEEQAVMQNSVNYEIIVFFIVFYNLVNFLLNKKAYKKLRFFMRIEEFDKNINSSLEKIRPQAEIDNFSFTNSNIIIEGVIKKKKRLFSIKKFETEK